MAIVTAVTANMSVAMLQKHSMSFLWEMVNMLQTILYMSMVNIILPPNLEVFMSYM